MYPKPVEIGDMLPDFTLYDQYGKLFDISACRGNKKIVLFFYPQDGSLNCTREACYFRDLKEVFDEAGAEVIGISGQSVESHRRFSDKNLLTYRILSDPDNKVRALFGVSSKLFGLLPERVTFVADRSGRVIHIFSSRTDIMRHVDDALKICLLLRKTDAVHPEI